MANQTLADLQAAVTKTEEVEASAVALINGIAGRIQAAVDAAIANGATAEELKPVTDEVAALNAHIEQLSKEAAKVSGLTKQRDALLKGVCV